jgi:hypothetical protein
MFGRPNPFCPKPRRTPARWAIGDVKSLPRWRFGLVCAALLAVVAAAWLRAETPIVPVGGPQLESGRFYAVDLSRPGCSFDLALDGCSRYELIVNSLGDARQSYRVNLEAIARSRVESFPATDLTDGVLICGAGVSSAGIPARRLHHNDGKLGDHPLTPANLVTGTRSVLCPPLAASCQSAWTGQAGSLPLRVRRFFLHVTAAALEDERGYAPVEGVVASEGKLVRVYLDRDMPESNLAPGLVAEIIRLFDEEIVPKSRELLGEHADVDHDGKLAVLVTPWLGKLCGGRTSLKGFVRANDFQSQVEAPFGNHADVVYLNSSIEPGKALRTLLTHEYTHAVCFSQRLADPLCITPLPEEEDWLNEAIAHVAENLHTAESAGQDDSNADWSSPDWSNLDWRIAAFLAAPQNSPLAVRDYYRAGLWRDPGCRGATFLFLRYCVDQFGEGLLRKLVESPVVGKRNLEQATGIAFPELFRRWTIAVAHDEIAAVGLHEKIGACELHGPAHVAWNPVEGPCAINLRGTSMSFVDLKHAGEPRTLRFVVHGDPAAQLQVIVVRYAE